MQTGTVKRNVKNLTLLSQLWSQAREHKRAIPVLREASRQSPSGELSFRLGQVLLADEQYGEAEKALREATKKGGMTQNQTGETWLLLGTAIFSQAGPEDRDTRKRARAAFVKAENYPNTARQAREWRQYVDAIAEVEKVQDYQECLQRGEQRKLDIERLRTQAQVCRLQGGGDECEPAIEQARALQKAAEEDICLLKRGDQESAPPPPPTSINEPEAPEEAANQ
jgi:tetratricopeptide (TPR) repeat protein